MTALTRSTRSLGSAGGSTPGIEPPAKVPPATMATVTLSQAGRQARPMGVPSSRPADPVDLARPRRSTTALRPPPTGDEDAATGLPRQGHDRRSRGSPAARSACLGAPAAAGRGRGATTARRGHEWDGVATRMGPLGTPTRSRMMCRVLQRISSDCYSDSNRMRMNSARHGRKSRCVTLERGCEQKDRRAVPRGKGGSPVFLLFRASRRWCEAELLADQQPGAHRPRRAGVDL